MLLLLKILVVSTATLCGPQRTSFLWRSTKIWMMLPRNMLQVLLKCGHPQATAAPLVAPLFTLQRHLLRSPKCALSPWIQIAAHFQFKRSFFTWRLTWVDAISVRSHMGDSRCSNHPPLFSRAGADSPPGGLVNSLFTHRTLKPRQI